MFFPLLTPDLADEFTLRISKVREALERHHIEAALIASTTNLFYLTGGVFRGYIYINKDKDPVIFMIPPAECNSANCVEVRKAEMIADILKDKGYEMPKKIGIELDDLYYTEVTRLAAIFEGSTLENASSAIRESRMIKTEYELKKMRQDGVKQSAVYKRVKHCYTEGMTDVELQIEIERVLRNEGCLGFLRAAGSRMEINMGSVLAGDNADVPSPYDFSMGGEGVDPSLPVGAAGIILHPGMSVMVDMNGGFNGYQTDMTRCWCISHVSDEAMRAHECSRAILRDLEAFAKPGVEIGELYKRAVSMADAAGLSAHFMGHKYHVRFIGHGVGIELNEIPVLMERNKMVLQKNMTLAIEPKFVFPGTGAVGVENTYIVTPAGLENITVFPEELKAL